MAAFKGVGSTTNGSLDEGTCSLDLAESQAAYFKLSLGDAQRIARETAKAVSAWRAVAAAAGATANAIDRMASAFEHDDLAYALTRG